MRVLFYENKNRKDLGFSANLVIKILAKINPSSPFKTDIGILIEKVSYLILATFIIAEFANANNDWFCRNEYTLQKGMNYGGFLFLAGIIFIFAQIFKKGIEIQFEKELTI